MNDTTAHLRRAFSHCLKIVVVWMLAGSVMAGPVRVDERESVALWPHLDLWVDAGKTATPEQALKQHFSPAGGVPGNLGRRSEAIWLRITLQVDGEHTVARVLELDNPLLRHLDVYVAQQGRVVFHAKLGNGLRLSERPMASRTLATALSLPPGEHVLLLRAESPGPLLLPLTLRTPANFVAAESRAQLLLGVIAGLTVCMMLYGLTHWVSLRDLLFLQYAVLLGGNLLFMLAYFGVGVLYLWPDAPWLSSRMPALAVLAGVAAGTQFMRTTLEVAAISRLTDRVMQGIIALSLASLALALVGVIDHLSAIVASSLLGPAGSLVVMPVAARRAWRGERPALYILSGWAFFVCGTVTMSGLMAGLIEPSFFNLFLFPVSTAIEMASWMAVAGLRVQAIHRNAVRNRIESDTLRLAAQTDALTGLPNRRGLTMALAAALPEAQPYQQVAVYMLDLDGFKPVNDRHGHEVGDALLVEVGRRLKALLRDTDVVARLGGDEFVVVADGLPDEAAAQKVGAKLLASFEQPFNASGQNCEVGCTIGYALAPSDGVAADVLLRRADEAMYCGKRAGRRRVHHGGCEPVVAA